MSDPAAPKPDLDRARDEALRLLDQFGFSRPPVDPVSLARDLGVKVLFVEFAAEDRSISAFYDVDDGAIFVNRDEPPQRQTFAVGHELGHKILHDGWVRSPDYRMLLRDDHTRPPIDPVEQEANAFAAHLLVPRFMLDRYRQVASVEELSELFVVPRPLIRNRLRLEYGT